MPQDWFYNSPRNIYRALSMAVACIGIKKKKHFLTEKLLLTNNLY